MTNPKQAFGDLKPSLSLVPASFLIYTALGLEPGAVKYGRFNWRINDVEVMTYISAAMRHLVCWVDGEEQAPDTGQPHLAHALASLAVLVDAIETGHSIDNRPPRGKAAQMIGVIEGLRRREREIRAEVDMPQEVGFAPLPWSVEQQTALEARVAQVAGRAPPACPDLDQEYPMKDWRHPYAELPDEA